jgi:hypothetical protein
MALDYPSTEKQFNDSLLRFVEVHRTIRDNMNQ